MKIFISYSHKDKRFLVQLVNHLAPLKREGAIKVWNDRDIDVGQDWADQNDNNLEKASIILLLITADFLASDYCNDKEMRRALERHRDKEARVIPIIVRSCDWHSSPFGNLQALPQEGKSITSWRNKDEAWTDVAKGIRQVVKEISSQSNTFPSQGIGQTILNTKVSGLGGAEKTQVEIGYGHGTKKAAVPVKSPQRLSKSKGPLLSSTERHNIGGLFACAIERRHDPDMSRLRAVLHHLDLSSQEKANLIRLSEGFMIPKLYAENLPEPKVNQLLADLVEFGIRQGTYEKYWREEIQQIGFWLGVFPAQFQAIEHQVKR